MWLTDPVIEGDTGALIRGSHVAIDCLSDATWVDCGAEVLHFPLIQYLITVPALSLGMSDAGVQQLLVFTNVIALVGAGVVLITVGRHIAGRCGAWLMAAVAFASPLLVLTGSTFREPLTASLTVFFVAAVLMRRSPWLIGVLAFLATVGGETAAPFVVALGVLATRGFDQRRLLPRWSPTAGVLVGAVLGFAANAMFNVFRFGSVRNTPLLVDEMRVPRMLWRGELGVSLWVSPNGGLLFFWFVPVIVIAAVAIHGLTILLRRPSNWWLWAPRLGPVAIALTQSIGLASWWSPWGWHAWGPRLSYPLTAACALLALYVDEASIRRVVERAFRSPALVAAMIGIVAVSALPNLGATYDQLPYRSQFFGAPGGERCPVARGNPVSGTATVEYYYECQLLDRAWRRRPLVLVERAGAAFNPQAFAALALSVTVLALLVYRSEPHSSTSMASELPVCNQPQAVEA